MKIKKTGTVKKKIAVLFGGCSTEYPAFPLLAELAGIQVPRAVVVNTGETSEQIHKKAKPLSYPIYVKPVQAGSSFGLSKIFSEKELDRAVQIALEHDDRAILEENIQGVEVGCSILGNQELIIGRVDEIQLDNVVFDYEEKYNQKHTTIHLPARISRSTEHRIQNALSHRSDLRRNSGSNDFSGS